MPWCQAARAAPRRSTAAQKGAIDQELLLLTCGLRDNVVRVIPPLTVSAEEVETGAKRLLDAMAAVLPTGAERPVGAQA